MDATAIPGAACATHPDQAISGSCERCGSFVCARCIADAGGMRCPSCVARDRLTAPRISADEVIKDGFALPLRVPGRVLPFVLINAGFAAANNIYSAFVMAPRLKELTSGIAHASGASPLLELYAFLGKYFGVMMVASVVVSSLATAGYIQIFASELQHQPRTDAELWRRALAKFLPTAGAALAWSTVMFVGMLLCCVPGIGAMVVFSLAIVAVGLGSSNPIAAMRESWRLVMPRFWLAAAIVAVGMAAVLGAAFVGAGLNASLKFFGPPGQIAGAIATSLLTTLAAVPMQGMATSFYLRARGAGAVAQ